MKTKIKEILFWIAFGAISSLLVCTMYFCSMQAAEDVTKCRKSENSLCTFFEVVIQRNSAE
jgi:hypothetical protein